MYKISIPSLNGNIKMIPSKSDLHRALFCALLSKGKCKISNVVYSDDILATISVLRSANCIVKCFDEYVEVDSTNLSYDGSCINCGDSATTLRLAIPVFIYLFSKVKVSGSEQLSKRPLSIYFDIFDYDTKEFPILFSGTLKNHYVLDGSISSQFISGLLLVLPLLELNSKIEFNEKLQSVGYVDMTRSTMNHFGVDVKNYNIKGNQKYYSCDYVCESDYSNYAFFKVANDLGASIEISNMNNTSLQPDRVIDTFTINNSVYDIENCPDLLPILAVYCCFKSEASTIINISRTMIKESNRALAISTEINRLGGNVTYDSNNMYIKPTKLLNFGEVSSHNDHRIAMALIILAFKLDYIIIDNIQCINKSYPTFLDEIVKLGGKLCLV